MPRTMPGQLKNQDLRSKNNEEDFLKNQTWTRCMFGFFAQRRLEELCSLLSFSWSLDYSHTGFAEILKQAGKGALSMQNILLYGNESTMWQLLNSSESPKQMLLLMVGKEVFAASKSKSNAYLCLYFVCLALFFFFSPSPSFCEAGPTRRTFPASADWAVGILVETGNSVDYSLAIRLLSPQWLSLLHHEIAWLSARLESVLCSNPPARPPPTDPPPLHPSKPPFPSLSPPRKKKKFIWLPSGQRGSAAARQVD